MDKRPPFPADFRLFVASQSPRRHSLLRDIGVPFTIAPSAASEVLEGEPAAALAESNATAKVKGVMLPTDTAGGAFVLGTDTVVAIDGLVMGKPSSAPEAVRMLTALSGRTHQVVSGVALARTGGAGHPSWTERPLVASAATDVTFLPLEDEQIEAYVSSAEWKGKAGGYAVQGLAGVFVAGIRGEYSNVVGLPLCLLARLFRETGFDVLRRQWL